MTQSFHLDRALLASGWASNVRLQVDDHGTITSLVAASPTRDPRALHLRGVTLPGIPNLHSHAFQRALAGQVEVFSGSNDNFWSWRRQMYRLVTHIQPSHLQAIAEQLYLEMLKSGYTSVAEFHYLHHDHNGQPFSDLSTMSGAILQAAATTGIGLTHLPVLYMSPGFDGGDLGREQRRFGFSRVPDFLELVHLLLGATTDNPQIEIGIAPHSLRAVPVPALRELVAGFSPGSGCGPIHIHIAEQTREVAECIAHTGGRPIQHLCEQLPLDQRWCLVHATHIDSAEIATLAATGAVVGLCPTTEANLGDGLFPLSHWHQHPGALGIGSDSNTSVSPLEELRWLEYGQRLQGRRRNIFADSKHPHVGANLWRAACRGGAQALGRNCGAIATGMRADMVVVDPEHPLLLGREDDELIDSLVFSGNDNSITQVFSGGKWLIRDGHHACEDAIARRFGRAIKDLTGR
jgi:formimidoylglutamate deiminase